MKKSSSWAFVLYMALTLIVGCNGNRIVEEFPEPMKVTGYIPIIFPTNANPHILRREAVNDDEVRKIDIEFSEIIVITDDIGYDIEQINDWRIAHDMINAILKENSINKFKYYLEQIIANKMLSIHLLSVDATYDYDRIEAVEFYTELLLKNNHPNAHIILDALEVLDGYWPYDRIIQAADDALLFAEEYLSKQNFREVAGMDKESTGLLKDKQMIVLHKIHYAIPELMNMIGEHE